MKKIILFSSSIIISSVILFTALSTQDTNANAAGAQAYCTGSPGDGVTCTDCHFGTASSGGTITSDIPGTGYAAGATYNFTASISGSSSNDYGFEISPQDLVGNILGTLSNAGSGAKLISGSKFVTHNAPGTGTSKSWTFKWTAPASTSTVTSVTFYGAFLVGNNNNLDGNGDLTYNSSVTYSLNPTAGISELSAAENISVYPNPVAESLHLNTNEKIKSIQIYNVEGKLVKQITEMNENTININDLKEGYYNMNIHTEKGYVLGHFIKQ